MARHRAPLECSAPLEVGHPTGLVVRSGSGTGTLASGTGFWLAATLGDSAPLPKNAEEARMEAGGGGAARGALEGRGIPGPEGSHFGCLFGRPRANATGIASKREGAPEQTSAMKKMSPEEHSSDEDRCRRGSAAAAGVGGEVVRTLGRASVAADESDGHFGAGDAQALHSTSRATRRRADYLANYIDASATLRH